MKDYSQYGEQAAILAHTPATGSLLDLGAFHPTELSNSRALIEHRGYAAVLVDAGPTQVKNLAAFYAAAWPKVRVMQAAVFNTAYGTSDVQPFDVLALTDDAVSTASLLVEQVWKDAGGYYGRVLVPKIGAYDIVRFSEPFDFINIDVEGQSADIFLDLLNHASPKCWCVEHDDRADELERVASHHGYRVVLRNGTNLVLAR